MKLFINTLSSISISLATISPIVAQEAANDRASNTVILTETGVQNLKLETVMVEERDFESTIFAIGRVEDIPGKQFSVSSRIAGRATSVNAFLGDEVIRGQLLAQVESRQPGNPPPTIDFKAPADGIIYETHVLQGQPVEPSTELFDIADRSEMWIVAQIPEQRAAGIAIGTKARISFPALDSEPLLAELLRFGVKADREAGAIEAIFQVANPDRKLLPGMRAELQVIKSSRPNVLAIPEASLQGDPADRVVYVKDFDLPNAFVRAPIVIGEKGGDWVEVIEGLFPGDEVVTRGAYSLGFVGGGAGPSLKEALDAAHGHEHAEDGSELTDADKAGAEADDHDDHGHASSGEAPKWLTYYAIGSSIIILILAQLLWNSRSRSKSSSTPAAS